MALGKGPQTPVREVMSPEVMYCFEDDDTDAIARNMADIKVRRLPVVNRDKRLVGIIALGDLAVVEGPRAAGEAVSGISRPGECTPRPAPIETVRGRSGPSRRGARAPPRGMRQRRWRPSGGDRDLSDVYRRRVARRPVQADGSRAGTIHRKSLGESSRGGFQRRDDAVQAAHAAFPSGPWASMTPSDRGFLYRFADVIAANAERLADLEHVVRARAALWMKPISETA